MSMIKVRQKGEKRWRFLSRKGTTNLRIHACRFDDDAAAQGVIDENRGDNPEWEWKVVK